MGNLVVLLLELLVNALKEQQLVLCNAAAGAAVSNIVTGAHHSTTTSPRVQQRCSFTLSFSTSTQSEGPVLSGLSVGRMEAPSTLRTLAMQSTQGSISSSSTAHASSISTCRSALALQQHVFRW
jgi:hypothetical protein